MKGSFKAILNTEEGPALFGLQKSPATLPFVPMMGTLGGLFLFRTGTGLNGGIGQRRSEVVPKYPFQKLPPTRRARAVNLRRLDQRTVAPEGEQRSGLKRSLRVADHTLGAAYEVGFLLLAALTIR